MKGLFEVTDVNAAAHSGEHREYHGWQCQKAGDLLLLAQEEAEHIQELFSICYISVFKELGNLDSAAKG